MPALSCLPSRKTRSDASFRVPTIKSMASCVYSSQIVLSDSLLRLIHHYSKLGLQRLGKDRNHGKGASANDLIDDLERVVRAEDLQVVVKDLTSRPSFYKRLQQSLVRYRWISAAGGWPQIPRRVGHSGPPCMTPAYSSSASICRRWATSPVPPPIALSTTYDQALKAAVPAFQKCHHLGADAVVDPTTRAVMKFPL